MKKITVRVAPDGTLKTLYTEAIDLTKLGRLHIERASNVEYDNERQGWTVALTHEGWVTTLPHGQDNRPIQRVFATREEALSAEVEFLQAALAARRVA